MGNTNKPVIAKVRSQGVQKRLTVPTQKETEEWEVGDIIQMEKLE